MSATSASPSIIPAGATVSDVALGRAAGLGAGRSGPDASQQLQAAEDPTQPALTKDVGSNWAKCHRYEATQLASPSDVQGVVAWVREALAAPANSPVRSLRTLGSRHSFSNIADSKHGTLISVEHFAPNLQIDASAKTATFSAGWRYGELSQALHAAGWALHNLASLPHISVAGACATATHGSGDRNGNLATAVREIEFVNGKAEIVRLKKGEHDDFEGAVVAMGLLGIMTKLTVAIEPTFDVRQDLYDGLKWSDVLQHFDALTSSAYSTSMFTLWSGEVMGLLWLKSRVDKHKPLRTPPDSFFGVPRETLDRHPLHGFPADPCTIQSGVAGPWSERLSHFRLEFTPSSGDELQTEYMLPRRTALKALAALRKLSAQIEPLLLISEIRTAAPDSLWMSGSYADKREGASVADGVVCIHFTWKPLEAQVRALLPTIEAALLPLGARPHWGKIFLAEAEQLHKLYPKWEQFKQLVKKHDPQGIFANEWSSSKLGITKQNNNNAVAKAKL